MRSSVSIGGWPHLALCLLLVVLCMNSCRANNNKFDDDIYEIKGEYTIRISLTSNHTYANQSLSHSLFAGSRVNFAFFTSWNLIENAVASIFMNVIRVNPAVNYFLKRRQICALNSRRERSPIK